MGSSTGVATEDDRQNIKSAVAALQRHHLSWQWAQSGGPRRAATRCAEFGSSMEAAGRSGLKMYEHGFVRGDQRLPVIPCSEGIRIRQPIAVLVAKQGVTFLRRQASQLQPGGTSPEGVAPAIKSGLTAWSDQGRKPPMRAGRKHRDGLRQWIEDEEPLARREEGVADRVAPGSKGQRVENRIRQGPAGPLPAGAGRFQE
jgi:hypothetical protein